MVIRMRVRRFAAAAAEAAASSRFCCSTSDAPSLPICSSSGLHLLRENGQRRVHLLVAHGLAQFRVRLIRLLGLLAQRPDQARAFRRIGGLEQLVKSRGQELLALLKRLQELVGACFVGQYRRQNAARFQGAHLGGGGAHVACQILLARRHIGGPVQLPIQALNHQ